MAKGGKRKGAGMPKGTKIKRTLEKDAVMRSFRQRVMTHTDSLFHAQLSKAVGSIQVFRIDEEEDSSGKVKKIHTLVTDADEIKQVLDEGAGGAAVVNEHYYFVTNISPDNKAIDSMMDRTFGKAQQSIEISDSTDAKLKQIKEKVQQRADDKGITFQEELQNYVTNFATPEIKEKLVSELVN